MIRIFSFHILKIKNHNDDDGGISFLDLTFMNFFCFHKNLHNVCVCVDFYIKSRSGIFI